MSFIPTLSLGQTDKKEDERLARIGLMRRFFQIPEMGAVIGLLGVFIIFMIAPLSREFYIERPVRALARVLDTSATSYGVIGVSIAMLMIAGEFDLSVGFMTGSTGLITALLATKFGWDFVPAMAVALIFALAIGFFNGVMRILTGLPSFVITLGTMFVLRSSNFAITHAIMGTNIVTDIDEVRGFGIMESIFTPTFYIAGVKFYGTIFWWAAFTAFFTWFMLRTRWGSWIFASGGDPAAAKSVGVPVERVKIGLFMFVHACAWITGMMVNYRLGSAQSSRGEFLQFLVLVAAVTGGNRMTGGYGSVLGASLGVLIFGFTRVSITAANWNTDWFFAFLGAMLLLAIVLNLILRTRAEQISTAAVHAEEEDQMVEE